MKGIALSKPYCICPNYQKCGGSKTSSVSPNPVTELLALKRTQRYGKVYRKKPINRNLSDRQQHLLEFVVLNMYWNHNSVYYPWVQKEIASCRTILDVGCGDGSLALFLDDGTKKIYGIDTDDHCIEKALSVENDGLVEFSCCSFEDFTQEKIFDAVVFVASIHHMDMAEALKKAKSLLSPSGKILIVGLASPSSITDWILEAARVIPSKVISSFHHMQTSEELGIKTDYNIPLMKDIRSIVKQELPGARMHYALHYRYLLEWVSP